MSLFRKKRRGNAPASYRQKLFAEFLEDRDLMAVFAVAPTGNDTSGTGGVSAPFRTIQRAVNAAADGGDTILVAAGSYTYDASQDTISVQRSGTQNVVSIFNKQVNIYGGYTAVNGFTVANPIANPTIIDGQNQFRDMFIVGFGIPTGASVQGITFRNGLGAPIPLRGNEDAIYGFGGGVFIDMSDTRARTNSAPTIFTDVTFENNKAVGGAGLPSDPTLNFGGAGAGGALELRFANDVRLSNVIFRNNQAIGGTGNQRGGVGNGGAIHTDHAKITGTNLLFEGNQAVSGNGNAGSPGRDSRLGFKADGTGGAVSIQIDSVADFTNVVMVNNVVRGGNSSGDAGDAYGAAFFSEQSKIVIRNAIIQNNLANGGDGYAGDAGGGGIQTDRSDLTLDRVKILNNSVVGGTRPGTANRAGAAGGGGVYSTRINKDASFPGTITITNSVIADNRAELAETSDINTGGAGAGVWLQGVTANIAHTTIANNTFGPNLTFGQAIILLNDGTLTPTVLNLSFSTVTGHDTGSSAITLFNGTTANLNTNLIRNRSGASEVRVEPIGSGANSNSRGVANNGVTISGNPAYTSPSSPNFDYSIQQGSAAINIGTGSTLTTDIGGQPRIDTPDLGAFEFRTGGGAPFLQTTTGAAVPTGPTVPLNPPVVPPPPPPPPPPPGTVKPVLVGYPQFGAGGTSTATLYNPDKTVRFTVTPFPGFTGGIRTAAADVNRDGIADLIVGTGPGSATQVRIYDGVTQAVLFSVAPFEASFTGGVYISAGDLNGDGNADLAITPDEGGGPRVDVYSGAAGFPKMSAFFGIDDPNFRGGARSTIADMTGDGVADLIVVAGFGGGPRVAGFDGKSVISGTPQKIFSDFFALEQALRNGIFVTAGDINGDGFADLIAGGGPGGGPRILAFDGKSLLSNQYVTLANFFGGDVNSRGGIRVAVKNLDGDARADLVVGSGSGSGSRITGYLGANIAASGTPPAVFDFDAGFGDGIFVG